MSKPALSTSVVCSGESLSRKNDIPKNTVIQPVINKVLGKFDIK